jgi:hypothetical protein
VVGADGAFVVVVAPEGGLGVVVRGLEPPAFVMFISTHEEK